MVDEDKRGRREDEPANTEIESVRKWLSFMVVGGFVLTLLFLTIGGAVGMPGLGPDLVKDIASVWLGVVGAVIGYYFGKGT